MEILTLLKANIRHKKGSFVSIILLMIIISLSLTAIISVKDNTINSIGNEMKRINASDLTVMIKERELTDEILEKINNSDMVESTSACPSLITKECRFGENVYSNIWFLRKLEDNYRLMNSSLSDYTDETPALKKGEIYLTLGVKSAMPCEKGDTITVETVFGEYEFTVSGFIAEPVFGAFTIGWKQIFISDEDFDNMYTECSAQETEEKTGRFSILSIKKSDSCKLSQIKFRRQLNLDTGIINHALGSHTEDQSVNYTNLYPEIIMDVLTVFIIILLVIVLIVIGHSITTTIEMDYAGLGVLKSQGFTIMKIRMIFVLQYLSAQLIGAFIGTILAIPLISIIGNVFEPIIAVCVIPGISVGKVLASLLAVVLVSAVFIVLSTRKIVKISPVRAISGGHNDVYFDSRMNVGIKKNWLSPSLALRQFTSARRQYIGIFLIVSLLVFFMTTIMILGNIITSQSAMESLGIVFTDCTVSSDEKLEDEILMEIENEIEAVTPVTKKYYTTAKYLSINGEEMYTRIFRDPEMIPGITDGRAPLYDNEIIITEILAEELDLKMGDKVNLAFKDEHGEYIISGIFQSTSDAGRTLSISLAAVKKLGIEKISWMEFCLEEPSKSQEVADRLNEKFGASIHAEITDNGEYFDVYQLAIDAMKAVIYSFSVIFALVVVSMVCKKTFLKERTDIGIYKSLGFTSGKLRLQFAVRFLLISVIGSVIGTVASILFSQKLIVVMLKLIGVTSLKTGFNVLTIMLPVLLTCICFFAFSYIAASKIKKVEVKELVSE